MGQQLDDLLTEVFDGAAFGMVVVDRAHRILVINRMLAALNGASAEAQVGKRPEEIVPHLAAQFVATIDQVFETGRPVARLEVSGSAPGVTDGEHVWDTTFTPVVRDGEVVAVTSTVVDATARSVAERALRKSEAQFRAICEFSPIGIFLTDEKGENLYSNPENLRQMGLTAAEGRGAGWQRALHPEDADRVREAFYAATRSRQLYDAANRYLRPDGTVVHVAVKARAVYDGDTVIGYVGMAEDIGDRRAAEQALRESEMRFRELAENIDDVFWLADDRRVYYVSPAYAKVWGRPPESVVNNREAFFQTIHPDDRIRVKATFERPSRVETEYRIVRPDGSLRWIRDRSFPVRDEHGRFVRTVGIATDVTPRKALEAELLQTQKLESLGRLAGGVAHDFNNLLTVILSQTRLAARAFAAGHAAVEELGQIEEAASRAVDLTRQLLTFARRQATHPTPVDITEVTAGIEKLLRRVIGDDVELVARLDPDVGIIRADRAQIEQVLINLAVNARDAMPRGGTLTIETRNVFREMSADQQQPFVLLRVHDDGGGIAPEHLPHVFDPFFTTKRPGEGTGLGLATCYGIVQQHGGEIEIDSERGKGTTFSVYFPRIDAEAAGSGITPAVSEPTLVGSETVLLVEDDALVRNAAAAALRGHGFTVVEATSAEDALAAVARDHVDIVVSDVAMRGMGGGELAERLAKEHPGMPVLLTSGYAAEIGATPFLPKPYVPSTLVRRIRELLDR